MSPKKPVVRNQLYKYKIKFRKSLHSQRVGIELPPNCKLVSILAVPWGPSASLEVWSLVIEQPSPYPFPFLPRTFQSRPILQLSSPFGNVSFWHGSLSNSECATNWIYSNLYRELCTRPRILCISHSAKQGRHKNGKWERERGPADLGMSQAKGYGHLQYGYICYR